MFLMINQKQKKNKSYLTFGSITFPIYQMIVSYAGTAQ